ncbi:MAG: HD domain-containing protein [bacterium]
MDRFEFFDRIPAMKQADRQRIQWAYGLAKSGHSKQFRDSGERYFEHVRSAANILIDHGYVDPDYLIVVILHDLLEDTVIPVSMLEQLFGPRIARGILTISKKYGIEDPLTGFVTHSAKRKLEEYFASIARAEKFVIIAKCADRIHNLSGLVGEMPADYGWTPERRLKQVTETRTWVIPLALVHEPRFAEKLEALCALIEIQANHEVAMRPPIGFMYEI